MLRTPPKGMIALVVALGLAAVGCGEAEEPPEQQPAAPARPVPPGPAGEEQGPTTELRLVAEGERFDKEELATVRRARVRVTLENRDPVPHNFSVYQSERAEEAIFIGEAISGRGSSTTYEFDAPEESGTYFFRCDIHPTTMTGNLVVG